MLTLWTRRLPPVAVGVLGMALGCSSAGRRLPVDDASATTARGDASREVACRGTFPAAWNDGTGPEPALQIHAYDSHTIILRQSLATSFEAPFLYLLIGSERALLLDTGAGGIDLVMAIDELLAARVPALPLLVVNTHGHGDHVAGNARLAGRPGTRVIGSRIADLVDYFGFVDWPRGSASIDLGDRVVEVLPIPGHHDSHLAFFEPGRGLLFTGDSLYPGRLYVRDVEAYAASLDRLVAHLDGRRVCHVLGAHIEMTRSAGVDFAYGATEHPDERPLPLAYTHLEVLRAAVAAMQHAPRRQVHDDFIIVPQ